MKMILFLLKEIAQPEPRSLFLFIVRYLLTYSESNRTFPCCLKEKEKCGADLMSWFYFLNPLRKSHGLVYLYTQPRSRLRTPLLEEYLNIWTKPAALSLSSFHLLIQAPRKKSALAAWVFPGPHIALRTANQARTPLEPTVTVWRRSPETSVTICPCLPKNTCRSAVIINSTSVHSQVCPSLKIN